MVEKGSLNRPAPFVNYINCDPLSDHSKSKAQTTKVQQPCHTLQMPLAKINYYPHGGEEEEEEHQFFFTTGWKKRFAQQTLLLMSASFGTREGAVCGGRDAEF